MHSLAAELGMTVSKLSEELSFAEFQDWIVYYKEVNAQSDGATTDPDMLPPLSISDLKNEL